MSSEEEEYYRTKFKTKCKANFLEPKCGKRRQRNPNCGFTARKPKLEIANDQQEYTFISNDTWFHLANYVAPEDVGRYSLICRQSANSINSRLFWLQLHRRYCQQTSDYSKKSILPEYLQMKCIRKCDRNILRQRVIQALFYCYPLFKLRLIKPYPLESLVGRTYVALWYKEQQSSLVTCIKFKFFFSQTIDDKGEVIDLSNNEDNTTSNNVVDDWECLSEEQNNKYWNLKKSHPTSPVSDVDGAFILVLYSLRSVHLPSDIICNNTNNVYCVAGVRVLLSSDMITNNLELDFIPKNRNIRRVITVQYREIQKLHVMPWWHPDFTNFSEWK